MKNTVFLLILFCLCLAFLTRAGWAQSDGFYDASGLFSESASYNAINKVKEDIAILLEENKHLENEHAALKNEYEQLQAEMRALQEKHGKIPVESMTPAQPAAYTDKKPQAQINDLALAETQRLYKSAQIIDSAETRKLWELQLAELEYERRSLLMQIKIKEQSIAVDDSYQRKELNDLRLNLEENLEIEKELLGLKAEVEQLSLNAPAIINFLRDENRQLAKVVPQMREQRDWAKREVDILKDKRLLSLKRQEKFIREEEGSKIQLKESVNQLEAQFHDLNTQVEKAMSHQEEKAKIVNDIIKFDKENQELKEKIVELRKKVEK